jgi:hypothetical protein
MIFMMRDLVNLNAGLIDSPGNILPGLQDIIEFPEKEDRILSLGSSHVLNDFLDFTDYLIPYNRKTRHSITEDYYSSLLSL